MANILVLLALTLGQLIFAVLIARSAEVREYAAFVAEFAANGFDGQLIALLIAHVVSYAMLSFLLLCALQWIAGRRPLAPTPLVIRLVEGFLRLVLVLTPSGVLAWLTYRIPEKIAAENWLLVLICFVLAIGIIVILVVELARVELALYRSTIRPLRLTITDGLFATSLALALLAYASMRLWIVESSHHLGLFSILFIAYSLFLILLIFLVGLGRRVSVVAGVIFLILALQVLDVFIPVTHFRHKSFVETQTFDKSLLKPRRDAAGSFAAKTLADNLLARRGIRDLETGFKRWLENRPALPYYRSKRLPYPVFVVAAQGGGFHAAYHTALTLARLYDACPNFANHVFAISSVSGGGLGAAVFAELLRNQPPVVGQPAVGSEGTAVAGPTIDLCYPKSSPTEMAKAVETFFGMDLLAPVVGSMLLVDMPGFFVPPIRTGLNRAIALEFALEDAWRKIGGIDKAKTGLHLEFFNRWQPDGMAPALFMNATLVNYGIPIIFSQLNWSQAIGGGNRLPLLRAIESRSSSGVNNMKEVDKLITEHNHRLPSLVNVFDFRPDLEMNISTAVVLSARFPYVTPPGRIAKSRRVPPTLRLFENTNTMELMDGGYADNSGRNTARGILQKLEEISTDKNSIDSISLHLVSFTHAPTLLEGNRDAHHELITPIAAFTSTRLASHSRSQKMGAIKTHEIELFDHEFKAPLSWLLSKARREEIALRSGGSMPVAWQGVCCEITVPASIGAARKLRLPMSRDERAKLQDLHIQFSDYVPNQDVYQRLLDLVRGGSKIETGSLKQ